MAAEVWVRTQDAALRGRLRELLEAAGCVVTDVSAAETSALPSPLDRQAWPSAGERRLGIDEALVGETAQMRALKAYLRTVALTESNVLITGETGTGKEMVAQALHRASRRRPKPFVCINCAALPESLIESELFGYERGAFTGAVAARAGKLQQAHGGSVFFDEIGDMSPFAQAKILRAIEAREIYPLGGQRRVALDVRVIAATNRDLEAMVRDDSFRADLYFRLKVVRLVLPPLRERLADIPLLVQHWLPALNITFGRAITGIDAAVLRRLMSHSWPGNVRELKNVLEICFLDLPPGATTIARLPDVLSDMGGGDVPDGAGKVGGDASVGGAHGVGGIGLRSVGDAYVTRDGLRADEREQLLSALVATRWNISETARRLHWSRMTIYRRLAKYELPVSRPASDRFAVSDSRSSMDTPPAIAASAARQLRVTADVTIDQQTQAAMVSRTTSVTRPVTLRARAVTSSDSH